MTFAYGTERSSKHAARDSADEAISVADWASDGAESDFAAMLARGRWDLRYFSEAVLGITPHPGQDRLWDAILKRDQSGWRPRYLTISCSAGNRAGKTLGIAIPILHSTLYKLGMEPPNLASERDVSRWNSAPYEWYHFAIAQETAELVFIELTRILTGTHVAQKNGCPILKLLGKGLATWDKKYRGEYLWLQLNPLLGGGNIHFRTTGERAIGSLGKDMNGVSYDECGFDPHFDFIVNEVLNLRRLSTGGQMFLISTPTEGLTAFADKWLEGDPEQPDRKPFSYSIRMSTRENVGFGIDTVSFDRLIETVPPDLIPQNIDGMFIEGAHAFFSQKGVDAMFDGTMVQGKEDIFGFTPEPVAKYPEVQPPVKGGVYVQGVDPALTFDSTWSIVLHCLPDGGGVGVRAERQRGRTTGPIIAALATNAHNAYTRHNAFRCTTGIDATGFGGKMFRDLLDIQPLRSVEFGGTRGVKLKLLNDLKQAIETGKLKFPRSGIWLVLRRQLLGYRLDDKGLETDAVMALAVAWKMLMLQALSSGQVTTFDFFGTMSRPTRPL